jgi:ABC-2 type transport system ATP-binding protein
MEATLRLSASPMSDAALEPAEPPLLVLEGISKAWGALKVLDDLDLELPAGSHTWIGGANGAGKTTLLRIACGLLGADAGSLSFDGLDPRRDRRAFQRRLGFLSAGDRGIYARLTVEQQLRLWARIALLPAEQIEPALERTSEQFGLARLLSVRADRLSMGQRQRMRLAMTFLHEPSLVLLDEPLTSLDRSGAELLEERAEEVVARGGVVVWCSPGNDREQSPSQRRYWLADGKLTRRQ